MKENFVAFISESVKQDFEKLKSGKFEDRKIVGYINRAVDSLKQNPLAGIKIPKSIWPLEYIKNYQITNLWKYNLPNAWRLIYTLDSDEIKIMTLILDWMNHKDYENKFSY
jgi:Txe/YoeB family toxin of Txe-Axe toxin-antitoxin module